MEPWGHKTLQAAATALLLAQAARKMATCCVHLVAPDDFCGQHLRYRSMRCTTCMCASNAHANVKVQLAWRSAVPPACEGNFHACAPANEGICGGGVLCTPRLCTVHMLLFFCGSLYQFVFSCGRMMYDAFISGDYYSGLPQGLQPNAYEQKYGEPINQHSKLFCWTVKQASLTVRG
jgi:hypothetical protein